MTDIKKYINVNGDRIDIKSILFVKNIYYKNYIFQ